jgi:hypothetical protein
VNPEVYVVELDRLRDQIRRDSAAGKETFPRQLQEAMRIIAKLMESEAETPENVAVTAMLSEAVQAFYNENLHRGWAQQFALQDIQKLENLHTNAGVH